MLYTMEVGMVAKRGLDDSSLTSDLAETASTIRRYYEQIDMNLQDQDMLRMKGQKVDEMRWRRRKEALAETIRE